MRERVRVEIPVRPTEKEEYIVEILKVLMDPQEIKVEGEITNRKIIATSNCLSSLKKLHYLLRSERILDSARKFLKAGSSNEMITVLLHKQALAAGRISFVSSDKESPLGAVRLMIFGKDVEAIINWLAPMTKSGRPVREFDIPSPDCL